jgi:leucyl-tRNA synthetase
VRRFLDRVWTVATGELTDTMSDETRRLVHKTTKKVAHDIEAMRFNTAVSAMMILTRQLGEKGSAPREGVRALVMLLAPFAPHLGEELWQRLGNSRSLAYEPWPTYDEALCRDEVVEVPVQVNGKVRGRVTLGIDAKEDDARTAALADANVSAHVTGKQLRKFLYVPGKIINIVVG